MSKKARQLELILFHKCLKIKQLCKYVPVAQLDRVSGFEPGGCRFKSCRVHQIKYLSRNMQAIILAGGKGLRLRPFTEKHPKALITIADKPLITHTLESLPDEITEIIIVVGYLAEQIKDYLGNTWQNKPIRYITQKVLQGTGDALLQTKHVVEQNFLVVNGDDLYFKKDLTALLAYPLSILAWKSTVATEFGLKAGESGKLLGLDSSSPLVNAGAYHLTKDFFDNALVPISVHGNTEYSLPHTLMQIAQKQIVKVVQATHWLPVGTPTQHSFANTIWWCLFEKVRTHFVENPEN